jgi:hypothetical protein
MVSQQCGRVKMVSQNWDTVKMVSQRWGRVKVISRIGGMVKMVSQNWGGVKMVSQNWGTSLPGDSLRDWMIPLYGLTHPGLPGVLCHSVILRPLPQDTWLIERVEKSCWTRYLAWVWQGGLGISAVLPGFFKVANLPWFQALLYTPKQTMAPLNTVYHDG